MNAGTDVMGRWRPPPPRSTPYITAEGYDALGTELREIWDRRADVTKALGAAAAEGDRSENAEYIYRKKQLGEIDRRIRYLQKRLPSLTIVREVADPKSIFFGAVVTLEKEDGGEVTYRIVGPDETDAKKGWISIDSPLARALLKKKVDDDVTLAIGEKPTEFAVLEINYPGAKAS